MAEGGSDLCRGWTEPLIRQAVRDASPRQQAVLAEIAENPGITSQEIADNLGLRSARSVGSTMAAWSRVTAPIGVKDPVTGGPSWPITFPGRRAGFWQYEMPPAVARVVLSEAARQGGR